MKILKYIVQTIFTLGIMIGCECGKARMDRFKDADLISKEDEDKFIKLCKEYNKFSNDNKKEINALQIRIGFNKQDYEKKVMDKYPNLENFSKPQKEEAWTKIFSRLYNKYEALLKNLPIDLDRDKVLLELKQEREKMKNFLLP